MELDDALAGELLGALQDYRHLLLHGLVVSEAADVRERDVKLRRAGELAGVLERGRQRTRGGDPRRLHHELWGLNERSHTDERGPRAAWFLVGAFPTRLYAGLAGERLVALDPRLWGADHLEVWYVGPEVALGHEDGFPAGPALTDALDRRATTRRRAEPFRPGPYPDRPTGR
jgi:hypothetical protein